MMRMKLDVHLSPVTIQDALLRAIVPVPYGVGFDLVAYEKR
jgi:hypothetical protein